MPREAATRRRVTLVLHKLSRGGSDRVATYLARGFRGAGINADLIVLCRGGEVEDLLSELARDIPIEYLGRSSRWRAWDLIRTFPRLVQRLRIGAPDAIVSTANNTSLVTALAVRAAGLTKTRLLLKTTNPIVSSRHSGLIRRLRLWSYRIIFHWTAAVWTLSADENAEMRSEFPAFAHMFRN
ncbi:MAG TPA: glycosyltransferase, partial [Sphingomicrobium sp.]|nr:glycosyltransferase [Sphingomicrobium sp.]